MNCWHSRQIKGESPFDKTQGCGGIPEVLANTNDKWEPQQKRLEQKSWGWTGDVCCERASHV